MKARLFAVFTILALAAWAPLHAQQATAPAAPSQQSQGQVTPQDSDNNAKRSCCAAKTDVASQDCCSGKACNSKDSCCEAKGSKGMACCSKRAAGDGSVASCCKDMKEGQCGGNDGKSCCQNMTAKDAKGCCAGMNNHCASHASGK